MSKVLRMKLAAAMVLVSCGGALAAEEPTAAELLEQIRALQEKVEQLERKQQQSTLTAAEVDATVERVLRDAERRGQLLQLEGFTAGYDKGRFVLQSADGNFVLNPYFQLQTRYVLNYREDAEPDGDNDIDNGFEIRRAKVGFRGNVLNPRLTYNIRMAFGRNGGQGILEDAFAQYRFADSPFFIRGGQWKDNVIREEVVSSGRQLAVDRSLLNAVMQGTPQYVQGVMLGYQPDGSPFRAEVALHDGINTRNTSFQDGTGGAVGIAPNYGASARAEYSLQGNFRGYDDFTAMGQKEDLLVLGGGVHYSEGGSDYVVIPTVDLHWEPSAVRGLGIFAALIGRQRELDGTSGWDYGGLLQAGYMLNDKWEVFGRYDVIFLDDALLAAGAEDTFHEFTVGANYYISGHTKFTLDLGYLPNGAPSDQTGLGILAGEGDQFIFRGQFQLLL
jgi:hypothetical protein